MNNMSFNSYLSEYEKKVHAGRVIRVEKRAEVRLSFFDTHCIVTVRYLDITNAELHKQTMSCRTKQRLVLKKAVNAI